MSPSRTAALCLGLAAVPLAAAGADLAQAWRLDGFSLPESVQLDPASGLLYVSNMGSDPMAKAGDGFISVIDDKGAVVKMDWVTGLNAPKGMDVRDGRLFVTGVDELVEIDVAAATVTARYPADGNAAFLNDVAIAPDGRVFVSDTFANRILVLEGGALKPFAAAPDLAGVNGLTILGDRLIAANLGDVSGGFANVKPGPVVAVDLKTGAVAAFGGDGARGVFDGVEPDGQGGLILTDNPGGKVLALTEGGTLATLATLSAGAADHEVVPATGLIVVPVTPEGAVVALKAGG